MCHCVSEPPTSGTSSRVWSGASMNIAATSFFAPSGCGSYTSDSGRVRVEDCAVVEVGDVDEVLVTGDGVADRAEAGRLGDLVVRELREASERDRDQVLGACLLLGVTPSTPPRSIGSAGSYFFGGTLDASLSWDSECRVALGRVHLGLAVVHRVLVGARRFGAGCGGVGPGGVRLGVLGPVGDGGAPADERDGCDRRADLKEPATDGDSDPACRSTHRTPGSATRRLRARCRRRTTRAGSWRGRRGLRASRPVIGVADRVGDEADRHHHSTRDDHPDAELADVNTINTHVCPPRFRGPRFVHSTCR